MRVVVWHFETWHMRSRGAGIVEPKKSGSEIWLLVTSRNVSTLALGWHSICQGCSSRGICLSSRRPRGSFLAGSASPRPHTVLPRSCLDLDLTASASALPHSFCLCLGSVWKVAPCLGSVVISQHKRASAHGAQVQV